MYKIESEIDLLRAYIGTLKKVQSATIVPRILSNRNNKFFKNQQKNLDFCLKNCKNSIKFAQFVHYGDFDIGLFYYNRNGKMLLKVFDGNGKIESDFTKNIFSQMFFLNDKQLILEKQNIEKIYKQNSHKKLLLETI